MDITQFCARKDKHPDLGQPYQLDEYDVASNGIILVCTKASGQYQPLTDKKLKPETIKKIILGIITADYSPAPALVLPESEKCSTCHGSGHYQLEPCEECESQGVVVFSNAYNSYAVRCASCSGEGNIKKENTGDWCDTCQGTGLKFPLGNLGITVNGILVETHYWALIKALPALETAEINPITSEGKEFKALAFRSGEHSGMVMPYVY